MTKAENLTNLTLCQEIRILCLAFHAFPNRRDKNYQYIQSKLQDHIKNLALEEKFNLNTGYL